MTIMRNLARNLQAFVTMMKSTVKVGAWVIFPNVSLFQLRNLQKQGHSDLPQPVFPEAWSWKFQNLIAHWKGREECEQALQEVRTDYYYYTLYVLSWFYTTKHFLFSRKKKWMMFPWTYMLTSLHLFHVFLLFCLIEAINTGWMHA